MGADLKPAPVLSLQGVSKVRTQGESRFELSVPGFSLHAGEFLALVGESGCGKSTLLDLLALISKPSAASAFDLTLNAGSTIDVAALWQRGDERALAALRRRHFGYVLQTGGLLPYLTVADNLLLPLRMNHLPQGRERVVEISRRLGVADCLARKPESLSGGQRQRVAILRALVHAPGIVLADEPTAAVDRRRARQIVQALQTLARDEGVAIIMVTHDLKLVEGVAERACGFSVEQVAEHQVHAVCRPESLR
jgi:putative ABC transport system ATP-binding protein